MTTKVVLDHDTIEAKSLLRSIAYTLAKSRKVVVVAGAGISCNAGIPDFRSEDGLYNLVKRQYPNTVVNGKDLFDSVLFSSPASTAVFFSFMAALRQRINDAHPTATHSFIKLLKDKGKLLRCYTQNIDGLESRIGLQTGVELCSSPDVIQLHGDIHSLKCMSCSAQYPWNEDRQETLQSGQTPLCPRCDEVQQERELAGKRSIGVGCLRPDIVLYGEDHPHGYQIGQCTYKDIRRNPDFLLILGTSLKVTGIRKMIRAMAKTVKERGGTVVLVNRTELGQSMWNSVIDYHIQGDSDSWVESLKTLVPDLFMNQTKIEGISKKANPASKPAKVKAEKLEQPTLSIPSPPATPSKRQRMQENEQADPRTPRTKRRQQGPLSLDVLLNSESSPRKPLRAMHFNSLP